MTGTWGPNGFDYGALLGTYAGGYGTPSTNPWSIGANVSEIPYGWGVPSFGADPIPIRPEYTSYLNSMATGQQGGWIPGSGTLNQFRLDQPGLLTTILGQQANARYGQGGTGDPTTGREAQTPQDWLNRPQLFQWDFNMGQTDATRGLDYIANLFGRPESSSGLSTAAFSAPDQYWKGLYDQIAKGTVRVTPAGWEFLSQVKGVTPQNVAQAAAGGSPITTASGGAGPAIGGAGGAGGAAGAAGSAGAGRSTAEQNALASIAARNAADDAARLVYQEWQMRTGDEQLAQQKAQQAWTQTFQQKQQDWMQQYQTAGLTGQLNGQDTLAAEQQAFAQQLARAGLTGTYEGAQTQQAQQQAWAQRFAEQQAQQQAQQAQNATGLGLLQAQSAVQGPRDWTRYWQMAASAPQGLTSALQSLAGRYGFAPGAQGTPGPATLQSRTQDLLSGGQQGQGGTAGAAAGSDGQAGNAWGWDLQNWQRMSPSMQQGVLGAAEAGGAYGPDVEALLRQAAPRYTGPAAAGVRL
jgi:hypothetical protein